MTARRSTASITPRRGPTGSIGGPEVGSACPSPPSSPPLGASPAGKPRRGGAAYTITVECERLFCETLRAVFLGEGNQHRQDSLVMGVPSYTSGSSSGSVRPVADEAAVVTDVFEMWDYVGGVRFRGFVADKDGERSLFVFFDHSVVGGDLKAGLMALLELCDVPYFSCARLVVCVDRHADAAARDSLTKDLGWIGFALATLDDFVPNEDIEAETTSAKWLFMEMET